jgi:uncharacterized protein (TIGR03083 family)
MARLNAAAYLAALRSDTDTLVEAGGRAGLDAPVPSCPDWRVAELFKHVGRVHRFVAACARANEFVSPDTLPGSPGDADLAAWVRDGAAALVEAIDRPADQATWTWSPEHTFGFWQRRTAHETAIHRVDAELAGGAASPIADRLAADGIDEWLHLLSLRPQAAPLAGHGETLHLHCTDVAGEWLVRLGEAGPEIEAIHAKGDVAVRGPASDLLLVLLRRADPGTVEVLGSRPVLDGFLERVRF